MNRNRNNNASAGGGIGVTGLLQVAFIVLKLCNVIEWSWWWVLAPTWGTVALVLLVLVIGVLAAVFDK
jgi:hypothetical protein